VPKAIIRKRSSITPRSVRHKRNQGKPKHILRSTAGCRDTQLPDLRFVPTHGFTLERFGSVEVPPLELRGQL
jgi:hypothetical protein